MAMTLEELMASVGTEARDMVFHAPWEARAFAVALTLCRSGNYEWEEFRRLLIDEVSTAESASSPHDYYRQFLRALERLLGTKRIVSEQELTRRIQELGPSSAAAHPTPARRPG